MQTPGLLVRVSPQELPSASPVILLRNEKRVLNDLGFPFQCVLTESAESNVFGRPALNRRMRP